MARKAILSICMTCRHPKPGNRFRRHNDELRTRHDSCIECEDWMKAIKSMKRTKADAHKDAYNKARYQRISNKLPTQPAEIKTRWIPNKTAAS